MFGKIGDIFIKKKWRNSVLIEDEKEAMLIARMEGLPDVDHNFDNYPVDMVLPYKRSFWDAVRKAVDYSRGNIYNMIWKEDIIN